MFASSVVDRGFDPQSGPTPMTREFVFATSLLNNNLILLDSKSR